MIGAIQALFKSSLLNHLSVRAWAWLAGTLRSLAMARLIALTDAATGPARLVPSAQPLEGETLLRIELLATEGQAASHSLQAYRALGWDDVQALADAEQLVLVPPKTRWSCACPPPGCRAAETCRLRGRAFPFVSTHACPGRRLMKQTGGVRPELTKPP